MTLRLAMRMLRKQPLFTGAILVMLALGIGATTAIFSVVQGVLLKPLPFPEADRILEVWATLPARNIEQTSFTEANFWDMRDLNRTFEEFGAWHGASFSLTGVGTPERLDGASVSVGFLRALGVRPVAGSCSRPGRTNQAPIGGACCCHIDSGAATLPATRTSSDAALTLDGRPYTMVGILPAAIAVAERRGRVRAVHAPGGRESRELGVSGHRPPQARRQREAAQADLVARGARSGTEISGQQGTRRDHRVRGDVGRERQLRQTLWMLLGAVGLLLVIACVNVTNLLLARASTRARESAVRSALGATRADLLRERITEALILSGAGAVLGWMVAAGLLRILKALDPAGIPRLADVSLNLEVLGFTVLAAFVVGVGTAFFLRCRHPSPGSPVLQHGQRGTVGDRRHDRLRASVRRGASRVVHDSAHRRGIARAQSVAGALERSRVPDPIAGSSPRSACRSAYPEGRREQLAKDMLARPRSGGRSSSPWR